MNKSQETVLHKLIYLDIKQKTCAGITSEEIRGQLIDFLVNECKAGIHYRDQFDYTVFDAARMYAGQDGVENTFLEKYSFLSLEEIIETETEQVITKEQQNIKNTKDLMDELKELPSVNEIFVLPESNIKQKTATQGETI